MPDILWRVILGALMTGAAAGVFYAFWNFFNEVYKPKPKAAFGALGAAGGQQPEISLNIPEAQTWMGKMNVSLLKNQWLLGLLERDYYGVGQKKEMEPQKLIITMEKFAAMGAAVSVGVIFFFHLPFNPGLIFAFVCLGFFMPHFNARNLIKKRQREALMNLPSFVDLLALTIESGLDYLNSMDRILATTFKKHGPLEQEIESVLREVQLGYPRRDALRRLARRVDVQEIRSLIGLLIQSDELGTGLVQLLRSFSQDMRNRRTGKAEEMAGKASTKMLGPLMIFIFPVIFALILLPFAFSLMKGGGGGMPF